MAEAILLGLEPGDETSLVGPVRLDQVRRLQALAERHGFAHASNVRSADVFVVSGGTR
jgi:hypothetical protein